MNKPKLHAVPEWFDGKRINEVLFSQDFLDRYPMKCINGQLFTEDGAVEDEEWVKQLILNEIRDCTNGCQIFWKWSSCKLIPSRFPWKRTAFMLATAFIFWMADFSG